jgi:DNA-directed RNA polymerase specialized sigma24 family protein
LEKDANGKPSSNDIDFVEMSVPNDLMDEVIHKYASRYELWKGTLDPEEELVLRQRKAQMVKSIYETAAKILTDRQMQIFLMRHLYNMKEEDIAQKLGKNQSLIPEVLDVCYNKIKKELGT